MISITTFYNEKWQIREMPEYKFAKKKLFNSKTGREIKKCLKGYTIGYNLRGKFYSLNSIKLMIEKIENIECPF